MITSLRLIGAIAIIFLVVPVPRVELSATIPFFIVYTLCGVTDAFDGLIARKLNATSEFGSKLDSAADLCFYTVMMVKLIPMLKFKLMVLVWILLLTVLGIRVLSYSFSGIFLHKFSSAHTVLNKITGGLVFVVPYFIILSKLVFNIYGTVVCLIALVAAVEEVISCIKDYKKLKSK